MANDRLSCFWRAILFVVWLAFVVGCNEWLARVLHLLSERPLCFLFGMTILAQMCLIAVATQALLIAHDYLAKRYFTSSQQQQAATQDWQQCPPGATHSVRARDSWYKEYQSGLAAAMSGDPINEGYCGITEEYCGTSAAVAERKYLLSVSKVVPTVKHEEELDKTAELAGTKYYYYEFRDAGITKNPSLNIVWKFFYPSSDELLDAWSRLQTAGGYTFETVR
jgi:hypothetical protein